MLWQQPESVIKVCNIVSIFFYGKTKKKKKTSCYIINFRLFIFLLFAFCIEKKNQVRRVYNVFKLEKMNF
jgi:hypothetical protein